MAMRFVCSRVARCFVFSVFVALALPAEAKVFSPPQQLYDERFAAVLRPSFDALLVEAQGALPQLPWGADSFVARSTLVAADFAVNQGGREVVATYQARWEVVLRHFAVNGEWIFEANRSLTAATSQGASTARQRLAARCAADASAQGPERRGVLVGDLREIGSYWVFLSKKTVFSGTCRIDRYDPRCVDPSQAHPIEGCVYASGAETHQATVAFVVGFGQRTSPSRRWVAQSILGEGARYDGRTGPFIAIERVVDAAAQLLSAWDVPEPVAARGLQLAAGEWPLMRCRYNGQRYRQGCTAAGSANVGATLAAMRTVGARTYDLFTSFAEPGRFSGLIPRLTTRVEWSPYAACWAGPADAEIWLRAGQQRIALLHPGDRGIDNAVDASLLYADGRPLWSAVREGDRVTLSTVMDVEDRSPQAAAVDARIPPECYLGAHQPALHFDQAQVALDMATIKHEVELLALLQRKQAEIFRLTAEGRRNAVCAVATSIMLARQAWPGSPLNDLDVAAKGAIYAMIEIAVHVGALPAVAVPAMRDPTGAPLVDPVSGDEIRDWDHVDYDRYVASNPAVADVGTACGPATRGADPEAFVETTERLYELLGYGWALAEVSADPQVVLHQPWLLSMPAADAVAPTTGGKVFHDV